MFGICFILPLPALVIAIGMECVPLQHPREGWRANYGAFTRDALMFFMICFGLCVQARQLMRGLSMSMLRMVLVSVAVTACSISLRMLVADMWVYPIPWEPLRMACSCPYSSSVQWATSKSRLIPV